MAFFSWQFICFLIVAVTVYYLIPGRFQWIVLLISSAWYYFVGGGPRAAVFVAVTVVTTWGGACLMDSIQKKEELKLWKRLLTAVRRRKETQDLLPVSR